MALVERNVREHGLHADDYPTILGELVPAQRRGTNPEREGEDGTLQQKDYASITKSIVDAPRRPGLGQF